MAPGTMVFPITDPGFGRWAFAKTLWDKARPLPCRTHCRTTLGSPCPTFSIHGARVTTRERCPRLWVRPAMWKGPWERPKSGASRGTGPSHRALATDGGPRRRRARSCHVFSTVTVKDTGWALGDGTPWWRSTPGPKALRPRAWRGRGRPPLSLYWATAWPGASCSGLSTGFSVHGAYAGGPTPGKRPSHRPGSEPRLADSPWRLLLAPPSPLKPTGLGSGFSRPSLTRLDAGLLRS